MLIGPCWLLVEGTEADVVQVAPNTMNLPHKLPPVIERRLSRGNPLGKFVLRPGGYRAFLPAKLTKVSTSGVLVKDLKLSDATYKIVNHCEEGLRARCRHNFTKELASDRSTTESKSRILRHLDSAYDFAFSALKSTKVSTSLLIEAHRILGKDFSDRAGRVRDVQNWVYGRDPHEAIFVPPPPEALPDALADFDRFIASSNPGSTLQRAIIAFGQFELIHPFSDGNGRTGRMMLLLLLAEHGIECQPRIAFEMHVRANRWRYLYETHSLQHAVGWDRWLSFVCNPLLAAFSDHKSGG